MSTLKEVIEQTDGNYNVKVGTKDGAGFVYCGSIMELREGMGALENRIAAKYRTRVKNAKAHLNQTFVDTPTLGKYCKKQYKETGEFGTLEGYYASLPEYFEKLEKAKASLERAETALEKHIPFGDREIAEVYKSIDEPNTAIILVQGSETGDAWTTDEYKEKERREQEAQRLERRAGIRKEEE